MRILQLVVCFVLIMQASVLAQGKDYVPDYFPAPKGGEWHYDLTTSAGHKMQIKTVITERTDASKLGYNIVQTSYTPQESVSYYFKKPGWVILLKTDMPSASYSADYVEDKNELMNPLKVGATWDYKGKMGGQDWVQTWKVVGTEEVVVPAGTYTAVKVESVSEVSNSKTEYTYWWVDQVGMVRVLTKVSGTSNDMVLTKLMLPK